MKPDRFDVVGIGCCAYDRMFRVEKMPTPDKIVQAFDTAESSGGTTANSLATISPLGARTALITAVGDDIEGKKLIADLNRDGVNTDHIIIKNGCSSAKSEIFVDNDRKRTIIFYGGDALFSLNEREINWNIIEKAAVYYTDLYPPEPCLKGAELAKEKCMKIVFDMQAPLSILSTKGITDKYIKRIFELTDIFFSGKEVLVDYMNASNVESALKTSYRNFPDKIIIATAGSEGSLIGEGNHIFHIPSYRVPVIDTTGAGDVHHGAFVFAHYLQNYSLEKSARFASIAAGLNCTKLGARTGVPDLNVIEDLLTNFH